MAYLNSSFTPVARNQVWSELLAKERKFLKPGDTEFHLNPSTMVPVPPKPTEVTPADFDYAKLKAELDQQAQVTRDLHERIEKHRKPPTGKFSMPQTASQEIGWFATTEGVEAARRAAKWQAPLKTCSETQFASAYYALFSKSQFAKATDGRR
mmetsp:Transcript_30085/g.98352  ORF Transcript_30085/g.98352 Transcript_30085/m.98352 type:complete len:153 (-) Transcript_30085:113-571(-)